MFYANQPENINVLEPVPQDVVLAFTFDIIHAACTTAALVDDMVAMLVKPLVYDMSAHRAICKYEVQVLTGLVVVEKNHLLTPPVLSLPPPT